MVAARADDTLSRTDIVTPFQRRSDMPIAHLSAPRSAREDLKVDGAQPSALPAVL